MKRTLLILLAGIAASFLAHLGWYEMRRPASFDAADGELGWMKTELKLSDAQYTRIREIHQDSNPQLLALAAQVSRMRGELLAFEEERKSQGQIDFLEFARFVENRRAIDRACLDSTRRLVLATAEVMNAEQRERYLGMVSPILASDRSNRL